MSVKSAYVFGLKDNRIICTEAKMCRIFVPATDKDTGMFEFVIEKDNAVFTGKVSTDKIGEIGNINLDTSEFGRYPMVTFDNSKSLYKKELVKALYKENSRLAVLQENAKIIGNIESVSGYATDITNNLSLIAELTEVSVRYRNNYERE